MVTIRTVDDPQEKALIQLDEARDFIRRTRDEIKQKRADLKAWLQVETDLENELVKLAAEKSRAATGKGA
jgi:histidinol-phosphate/aromatic aminotransferase/cobyric acid decarboxylase-like protein